AMISIYAEALADNAATLAMAMAVYSDEPVGKALEIVIAHIRDNFYALNRDGRMAAAAAQKAALLRR
ncbi:MAG: hypothetical protein KGL26_09315, partial [Pseudomonadota bacterium]|nr:hypothetical protein [Pseudomonadota bacterium]